MPRPAGPLRLEALGTLLENSGLELHKGNHRSWVLDCPHCGKEKKLYIRRRDGRVRCWYCGREGPLEGYPEYALSALLGKPVSDLQLLLYGDGFTASPKLDIQLTFSANPNAQEDDWGLEEDLIALEEVPPHLDFPLDFKAIDDPGATRGLLYLKGRGVSLELAQAYQLMYDPPRQRVVFPVFSRGELLGWQARIIGSTEYVDRRTGEIKNIPKILTTMSDGWRDRVLMFEHRLQGSPHAVLTEGPFDAIKCHLAGGNVCSMGKTVSDGQMERFKAFGVKRLYLAQDPDAFEETRKLMSAYQSDFEMYYMTAEGTGFEDFGAMPPELALECFKRAERVHFRRFTTYINPDVAKPRPLPE